MSLSIREAGTEDAAIIATLFSEFNAILGADGLDDAHAYLPEHVQVGPERMRRRLEAMSGVEQTLLAEFGGVPAAMLCLRLVPYIGQDAPYAEVTQLYVRPAYKRHGIGAALLAAAEARATAAGATCVSIITGADNADAQAFYRARGYRMPGVVFAKYFETEVARA